MSEEVLENTPRNGDLPVLDLTHLDPVTGITKSSVEQALSDQGIDPIMSYNVILPQPSNDGKLVIGDTVFWNSQVTTVYGLNKVTKIGLAAFQDSLYLSGKIWIDSCTELGEYAFAGCGKITEVVLSPTNTPNIPKNCFSSCNNLSKVHNLNKVTSIGSNAFSGCSGLSGKL
jgi:hypothetical protein